MAVRSNTLSRVVVLLAMAVVALFLLLANGVQAGDTLRPTETHVVQAGDTLWDIAAEHTPTGGDVRKTVADIQEMSDLEGGIIQPGDRLTVPLLES
jgi:Tfp pilus assembly protein FimV